MPDVFDVLSKDHGEVKRLLAELQKQRPDRGSSKAKLTERKKKVSELITEESRHEAVEEAYFWPAVRDKLSNGDELADKATGQEDEAKKVLAKLGTLAAGSAQFEKLLAEFAESGAEHIEFEETQVWPKLRAALSRDEAQELGRRLQEGKKSAPDRPKPGKVPPQRRGVPAQRRGGQDTAGKTKAELYEDARRLGVHGRSAMTKEELARELAKHR